MIGPIGSTPTLRPRWKHVRINHVPRFQGTCQIGQSTGLVVDRGLFVGRQVRRRVYAANRVDFPVGGKSTTQVLPGSWHAGPGRPDVYRGVVLLDGRVVEVVCTVEKVATSSVNLAVRRGNKRESRPRRGHVWQTRPGVSRGIVLLQSGQVMICTVVEEPAGRVELAVGRRGETEAHATGRHARHRAPEISRWVVLLQR